MQQYAIAERRNNIAPIPFEADTPFPKIIGELPRELNGTLYRNGPNPQFPSPTAHWFVGDGMLQAFHLENGKASYRNRYIVSDGLLEERKAGRALYGGLLDMNAEPTDRVYKVDLVDRDGIVHASVEKTIYIRKR